jgi:hypothetical protein
MTPYFDAQPWTADSTRFTVDSLNPVWSADGGNTGSGGIVFVPPATHGEGTLRRNALSQTVTLNLRF